MDTIPSRSILIVDDHKDGAHTLSQLLRLKGYMVEVCEDGVQCITLAERIRPHAMIMDLKLPGMSGYDVAQSIRAHAELKKMLLIAYTGYASPSVKARALAAGFDRYVVKPVLIDELVGVLPQVTPR